MSFLKKIVSLLTTKSDMNKYLILGIGNVGDEYDFHYFGWNLQIMNDFLLKTGFKKIERVKFFSFFNDTSKYAPFGPPISLNVIAYK